MKYCYILPNLTLTIIPASWIVTFLLSVRIVGIPKVTFFAVTFYIIALEEWAGRPELLVLHNSSQVDDFTLRAMPQRWGIVNDWYGKGLPTMGGAHPGRMVLDWIRKVAGQAMKSEVSKQHSMSSTSDPNFRSWLLPLPWLPSVLEFDQEI